ncbi:MAG: MSMEG_6728 family protein [Actinomycetales bacterium]
MQTFLPYPQPRRSAAALDDKRLGKQRVETLQVLRALTWETYGWKNHPAVRMWRGFVPALVSYGVAVCEEWVGRGRTDAVREQLLEYSGGRLATWEELRDAGELPPWVGLDALHASHQSSLVRKDPEHYRPLFPDVPDDVPYFWPEASFPTWPLRRGLQQGRPVALPVGTAAALLGAGEEVVEEAVRLVGQLEERPLVIDLRQPTAREVALVAALARPGRTAWVVPGEPVADDQAPPAPFVGEVKGGPAASIARPPTAEDRARMRAEGAAPELLFLRPPQLGETAPADVTLVVAEADVVPAWGVPVLRLRD